MPYKPYTLYSLKVSFADYCQKKDLNPILAITGWWKENKKNIDPQLQEEFLYWMEKLFCIEERIPSYMSELNTLFCVNLRKVAPKLYSAFNHPLPNRMFYLWVLNYEKDL